MYDKLKVLVVNDYFTPNIKAEVILDTLLTPYIGEMVKAQCGVDAVFVTKEMSVFDREQSGWNRSYGNMGTKIDYLLANEAAIYLVELKTTEGSIGEEQAERYLKNCRGRTFGDVFGDKLLTIMGKKTGVTPEGAAKPEDRLRGLFEEIFRQYGPGVTGESCADRARELLKQRGWSSTYKYLYTMGQLLDYLDGFPGRRLWDLPLKLLYVTPTGSLPHEDLRDQAGFYLRPAGKGSVSLMEAAAELEKAGAEGDQLAGLLAGIMDRIYGG